MSNTALKFAKEDLTTRLPRENKRLENAAKAYFSHHTRQVYGDPEDDDDEKGWSNRGYVEEEEEDEQSSGILEMPQDSRPR